MRKLHSVLLAATLSACAAASGGKAEIVSSGNEMIRLRWNPQVTSEGAMRSQAIAYCGGRNVEAQEASTQADTSIGLQARTWRCDPFPGTGAGM